MTSTEYRDALKSLGLSQVSASKVLGINERTSRRYAQHGIRGLVEIRVRAQLAALENRRAK